MTPASALRALLPAPARRLLKQWRNTRWAAPLETELGEFVLAQAGEFCRQQGGEAAALAAGPLQEIIRLQTGLTGVSEAHQYLQTAFLPHYEHQLYEYYRQQQYLMLLGFLSYPWRGPGCLRAYVEPLQRAGARLDRLRVLDYGAGIPYGLLHLLRTTPEKVERVTLVDLDLVHADFTAGLITRMWPGIPCRMVRLRDTEQPADLGEDRFNVIYGKDVFEHVHDPAGLLTMLLAHAEPACLCYFDLRDHGVRHLQHVTPQLAPLQEIVARQDFHATGPVSVVTEFVRGM